MCTLQNKMLKRKRSSEDKCGKKRVKFSLDIMPVYIYDKDSTSKMFDDGECTNSNSNAESTQHRFQVALRKQAFVNEELNKSFYENQDDEDDEYYTKYLEEGGFFKDIPYKYIRDFDSNDLEFIHFLTSKMFDDEESNNIDSYPEKEESSLKRFHNKINSTIELMHHFKLIENY